MSNATNATETRSAVVSALQESLTDLLGLSLFAKQIHWNVVGVGFRDLHLMLDEAVDEYGEWSDDVAERVRALDALPDGRPETVAADNCDKLTAGLINSADATAWLVTRLGATCERFGERVHRIGDDDVVSQDLLIGIKAGLDKQLWMMRAMQN